MKDTKKPRLDRPLLVEGKYDKIKIDSLFDGCILTTDGFGIFKRKDKQRLLRRLCGERGLLVLTDSDGGGVQIRAFLKGILPPDRVEHLYIPKIQGKEKRKKTASASGVLGVEGMDTDTLYRLLLPYTEGEHAVEKREIIEKKDLYADGLSGTPDAEKRRAMLCLALELPEDLTANALLEAVNLLGGASVYRAAVERLFSSSMK